MRHPGPTPPPPPGFSNCKSLVNKEIGYFLPEALVPVGRSWGGLRVQRGQRDLGIRWTEEVVRGQMRVSFSVK